VDVAKTGGWKNPRVLQEIYQQPDVKTLHEVVMNPQEVVEVLA
jgi:hypothetical protein